MKILFYRYGSICEPDIIAALTSLDIEVLEEKSEIHDKHLSDSERLKNVNILLSTHKPAFVFSINFFPVIADLCSIHKILYLSWSVDCPVMNYFSKSILHTTNRIFLFDFEQYQLFQPYNPDCIFHLPLSAAVTRFNHTIHSITPAQRDMYSSDISFIGSLYSEKNHLRKFLDKLSPYAQGYIDALTDSALQIYGCNIIEDAITDALLSEFETAGALPKQFSSDSYLKNASKYAIAHQYIGYHIAERERIRTLNQLASHFKVDLYTASDCSPLINVRTHNPIESMVEMPKAFHLSKINLNMTIKPIKSGLPLRVFDIMGCGGFLMTNYQTELSNYFDVGVDVECYASSEELIDKCTYYLSHDSIRKKIAVNGYEKICKYHTLEHRLAEMIKLALQNM